MTNMTRIADAGFRSCGLRRKLLPWFPLGPLVGLLVMGGSCLAAPYQDAVLNLAPSFYYPLNETATAGGAKDLTGHAAVAGIHVGDYVSGPPMVGGPGPLEVFGGIPVPGLGGESNLAHYSNNAGYITLGDGNLYAANAMTVAFFLKAGPSQGGDRLFTNNLTDPTKSLQIDCGNNGLVVAVDPAKTGNEAERTLYLEDNSTQDKRLIDPASGWFHVVVTTQGATGAERAANIKVWINGVNRTANLKPDATGWGVETGLAKIGGRAAGATAAQTHSGAQDEMAIWLNRALTETEVQTLWSAAITPPPASSFLVLHLKMDADTQDSSTKANHGTLLGAPEFVNDNPLGTGKAISFTANDMGVNIVESDTLASNTFTLSYWLKPATLQEGAGLERLTSRAGDKFETAIGNRSAVGGAADLTLSYFQGTGWHNTSVTLPLNTWSHVAWRNRGTGAQDIDLFVDGTLVYTGIGVPDGSPGNGFMNIGTRHNNVEGFEGLMDDVRLDSTPLKNYDIAALAVAADTDGDGLPDSWEVLNGLNPADKNGVNGATGDPDNDGLTNAQEYALKTKPKEADTDGDGLKDGAEVTRNTNPLVADTDKDGLNDGDEVTRTTNPLVADTDGDGINDGLEVESGTDPKNPLSGPSPSSFLVLHLKFDGGDTIDSSSKRNDGTLLGSPEFVSDSPIPGGKAISFTSNDMGVNIPGHATLASNNFTLSYWVKPTSLQEGAGLERLTSRAADKFETAIGNRAAVGGAPDLTLSYYQTTGWHNTNVALVQDEWAHVAWRNRGSGPQDLDLFVNGQLVYTGVGAPASSPGDGIMNIGTRHNNVEGFEGLMDDIRLYRASLRDSDVAALVPPPAVAGTLAISKIQRSPTGSSVTLTFASVAGRTYAVEYSTSLNATGQAGGWRVLAAALASGGAETTYSDGVASNLPRAYYRVRDVTR